MLDTDTKRRIDTARDILVGKVPDPKSQVEQITIALIYKFMDDMDADSEELGGKRRFFAGDFARYGWAKLMRSGLGGHETLNLYAEAIARMPENPNIPPLFRSIFNNAYLPYRDPETLKSFLKIIDEFEYDHSERLGDAFEYLLSVLGSQGQAGQFRTPRHIIDFMVSIVDPKKNETVLDPACGTAGFLISAYKHILLANSSPKEVKRANGNGESALHTSRIPLARGDRLSPDEKKRLADNFKGYDISPDMVRLSLVNMYLHGFTDPHIDEYDTLTSLDKWNQLADVILANPPFMSPKGGIRPHNRFSVQSKRSEVLFVDYMAEHLTPAGRAGIIVPEGIIFQSQTAYKTLRKMLVEQYLVAVVSLPAGVFNPYSGVKTSILILDKSLAKQSGTVGFFKVENDGFNLGAQRRPIDKNDLPQVLAEIEEYLRRLRAKESVLPLPLGEGRGEGSFTPTRGLIVAKGKIAAKGDYNLSGERYAENSRLLRTQWPVIPLGEFCTFMTGGTPSSTMPEYYEGGTVPWLVSGDIHGMEIRDCERRITQKGVENSNARYLPENSVLIALNGQGKTRGTVAMLRMKQPTCNQSLVAITPAEPARAIPEYVFRVLRSMYADIRAITGDEERSGLSITILKEIEIPLPPLEVQKEIVAEIEAYQKVIDGARAVLDHYRPHIPINPDWPMVELREVAENLDSRRVPITESDRKAGPYPYYGASGVVDHVADFIFDEDLLLISEDGANLLARSTPIAFSVSGKIWVNNHAHVLRFPKMATQKLVEIHLNSISIAEYVTGSAQPKLNQKAMSSIPIPLPPLAEQEKIVAEIEAEQRLAEGNRQLIERMEQKIAATLARIWGAPPRTSQPETKAIPTETVEA